MKHCKRLLKYKTKSEMLPTFLSGVFLSSSINVLTADTLRSNFFEKVSMGLMFASCILFFLEASRTHELQTGYASLSDVKKGADSDGSQFLALEAWNQKLGNRYFHDFWKKILPWVPTSALVAGILSLVIYFIS